MGFIGGGVTVTDVNKGWIKTVKSLDMLQGKVVSAGVFNDAGKYDSGEPVVQVAYENEYGNANKSIPPRPFIRFTTDKRGEDWMESAAVYADWMLDGKITPDEVADKVGAEMENDIRLTLGQSPPLLKNAPRTVKKKGFDRPLIETGKLQKAITHKVTDYEPDGKKG